MERDLTGVLVLAETLKPCACMPASLCFELVSLFAMRNLLGYTLFAGSKLYCYEVVRRGRISPTLGTWVIQVHQIM